MMKCLIFLLSIIGLSCAFSPDFEYTFHYNARLGTALPKLRSQVAGTGIEFDVVVAMTSASEAIIKFNNILVGDYHGDMDCDMRGKMPIEFHPLPAEYKALEDTFKVDLLKTKGHIAELSEDEDEWMTNIRRSVVNHFRITPMRAVMGEVEGDSATKMVLSADEHMPRSFTIDEDTILGRCPSQYTIIKLPEHFKLKANKEITHRMEKDEEFGFDNEKLLWRVVRSIDFTNCQDTVMLQNVGYGYSDADKMGRGDLEYMQSRTSVSEYILRGDQTNLRWESGINEGSYTMNTYGYTSQDEEIHLVTNQTMYLTNVVKGHSLTFAGPKKIVDTWKYQVISPYHRDEDKYDWVHFMDKGTEMPMNLESVVTGIKMDAPKMELYKKQFENIFEMAIKEIMKDPEWSFEKENTLYNTNSGRAAVLLHKATYLIKGLKVDAIDALFEHFYAVGDKEGKLMQTYIVDVIAGAGTRDAAAVLLKKFKEHKISSTRAATVFMTYTNNIVEPELYKDVFEFLQTIELSEYPYFGASAFINFGVMVHRQCISEETKNFTIPMPILGDHFCSRHQIVTELIPFLKTRLDSAQTSWERIIYIQTLSNIATPEVVEILLPYLYGQIDVNPRVRITAMYALAAWKIDDFHRDEVFDVLMRVAENLGENPQVRQRAVMLMLTWHPDSSWWQRMAALTWHEPSRQMQAFISSTIHTHAYYNTLAMGRQTHLAKHALHLARPITPSLRYSYSFTTTKFNRPSELLTDAELTFLTNKESVLPIDIDAFFSLKLGGFSYEIFDFTFMQDGLQKPFYNFFDKVRDLLEPSGMENLHNSDARLAGEIYQLFMDAVQMKSHNRHVPDGVIFTQFFENMQQVFTLNPDVFNRHLGSSLSIIEELVQGKDFHMNKYFNPVPITTAIASEVGLPIICYTMAPTINNFNGHAKLTVDGSANPNFYDLMTSKKVELEFDFEHKFVTKATTLMTAIVPWSQEEIGAGIDSERQFNLPIKGKFEYSRQDVDKYVKLTMSPSLKKKFPIVLGRNNAFTMVKGMWHSDDYTKVEMKPLYANLMKHEPLNHVVREFDDAYTGVHFDIEFDGDLEYPLTSGNFFEFLEKPERMFTTLGGVDARQWRMALFIDPTASANKEVTFKASVIGTGNNAGDAVNEPLSIEDSNVQRYQKTRAMLEAENIDYFGATRAELVFTGGEEKKYDAGFSFNRAPTPDQEHSNVVFYALRSKLEGIDAEKKSVCVKVDGKSPVISKFVYFDQLLKKDPKVMGHITLHGGNDNCMTNKYIDAEYKLELTEERKEYLDYEWHHNSCTMNKHNNSCNNFPVNAVYDKAHVSVKYDVNMPNYLKNVTYKVSDMTRGFLYPQIYFNHLDVHNPEGQIEIHGERSIESHYWKFWTKMSNREAIVDKFHVPEIMDEILPIGGVYSPVKRFNQILLREPVEDTKCQILNDKVYTFDEHVFHHEALPCWTVAVNDRSEEHSWVLETRMHGDHLEARLTSVNRGSIVEMKEGEVKVNGEDIKPQSEQIVKDPSGRIFVIVYNRDGKFVVEMPNKLKVFVHDGKIDILAGHRYKGMLSGICGDYDGEYYNDMQGPEHHIMNADLFYESWVSEDTDCPNYSTYKANVEGSRAKYPMDYTHEHQPDITATHFSTKSYCKQFVYKVEEVDDKICQLISPVGICKGSCSAIAHHDETMMYKCWSKDTTPAEVSGHLAAGFLETPVQKEGEIFLEIYTSFDTQCTLH